MLKNIAIAILLTVIALVLFRGCPGGEQAGNLDSLKAANVVLGLALDSMIVADSVVRISEKARQDSFKVALRAGQQREARLKANPVVKEIRIAYPVIDTLILTQDTTIMRLGQQVEVLNKEREQADKRAGNMLANSQQQTSNLQGINTSLEAFNKSQTKTIKWQKIELWAWRVGAAGALAWGATR